MNKLLPMIVLLAVLGAGCSSAPMAQNKAKPVASKMGFGKLPGMEPVGGLGTSEAISARPGAAVGMAPVAVPVAEPKADSMNIRVMPVDPGMPERPMVPGKVVYTVTGAMPDWSAEASVLRVDRPQPDAGLIRAVGSGAGVPGQIIAGIDTVQSVQASWRDKEGYVWSVDPVNQYLNWWKEMDYRMVQPPARPETPPKVDRERLMAVANAFLDAHGLSDIKNQGAQIDDSQWVRDLLEGKTEIFAPCPMLKEEEETMIYPSPCGGWWPQQITVFYGGSREGLPVVDAWGWSNRPNSVNVDVQTYQVQGGNVLFAEQVQRSAYPLISKEEAMKRLQAGGRNQLGPWGYEGQDIKVTIEEIKLAWMRYDTWATGRQETYFIPALAAKGKAVRGLKGEQPQPEEYHTVVPLVSDEAFNFDQYGGGVVPMPMPAVMEKAR